MDKLFISNIKFHIKFKEKLENYKSIIKTLKNRKCDNFYIFKLNSYTYISFEKSINITGCKNYSDIHESIELFSLVFRRPLKTQDATIDNITATTNTQCKISSCFIEKIANNNSKKIRFSLFPNFFPGIIIREAGCPTIVLFRNGKANILGAKTYPQLLRSHQRLMQIIHTLQDKNIRFGETQKVNISYNYNFLYT